MKKILFLICFVSIAAYPQQKWQKLNGPSGAFITSLYAKGDTIIAGTGSPGLLFYSINGGASWKQADIKVPGRFSALIFADDGGIIAASKLNELYKSNNLHKWEKVFNITGNDEFWSLGKDPYGFLYTGTDYNRIYFSSDNGVTWTISLNYTGGGRIESFALSSDSILYAGSSSKLFKKKVNVNEWDLILIPAASQAYDPFFDDDNVLYASSLQFLLKSTDQGNSWVQLDSSNFLFNNWVLESIYNNKIISAVSDVAFLGFQGYGVAVSDDKGYTWRYSNDGLPPRFSASYKLAKSGNNTYLGTNAAGVFKSTDFGDSWFPINNGITAATTLDLCFDNEETMYTANWSNGFQKSTDKGESWEVINNGLTNTYCYSIIADENDILLGGTDQGIFRSTNKGQSWGSAGTAGNNFAFHLEKDKHNRIYALTYGTGLYRSTNTGQSWIKIDNGFVSGFLFGFAIDSSGAIYAGTRQGAIYKSSNDGQSWSRVYLSSNPNTVVSSIIIARNGYIYAANINEGILRSTNNGADWQIFANGFATPEVVNVAENSKSELYSSTHNKLYKSTDMGENWIDITGEMSLIGFNEIHITKTDDMFFATYQGVWRNSPDSTTIVSDNNIALPEYKLHQNYPNPFNPSTKISYNLKAEGNVKLLIYDIKGELISTLVNQKQQAGSYEVDFTLPGSISTGVYIYRLTVTDNNSHNVIFSDVKKMVYLK